MSFIFALVVEMHEIESVTCLRYYVTNFVLSCLIIILFTIITLYVMILHISPS